MDKESFNQLKELWKKDTRGSSISQMMAEHAAYKAIIKNGWSSIPFIMDDFKENGPDHWFIALREITGHDDIVRPWHRGIISEMANDWLDWYKYQFSFENDCHWTKTNREVLFQQYPNQHVAVLNCEVVDSDDDFSKLAGRVYSKYGYKAFCMSKITEKEQVYRV